MKNLALKLDDLVFEEAKTISKRLGISSTNYINYAVCMYNQLQKRKLLSAKLALESKLVRKESMKVLGEFESIDEELSG